MSTIKQIKVGATTYDIEDSSAQPKETGKGLSTNDYSDEEKGKVASNTTARHTHGNQTVLNAITQALIDSWNAKQSAIADLDSIRSGASAGATAVQPAAIADFITKSVADLVNYYKKTETYTQTEVNALVSAVRTGLFAVAASLPAASADTLNKIYLIPAEDTQTQNVKDEYVTIDNGESAGTRYTWEKIGSTSVDLSGYVTVTALNTALADYTNTAALTALLAAKLPKATPTAEQGTKEYLYSFAGSTQNTDIAVINDMSSDAESYTDKMVPTAKSVATSMAKKASSPTSGHLAALDAAGNPTDSGKSVADFERVDDDLDSAVTALMNPQTPSALPMLCGQPPILFGAGAPAESVVPVNWNQYDPDTDTGYNWTGLPSALGQQYINISGGSSGRYIAVPDGEYALKWQNC